MIQWYEPFKFIEWLKRIFSILNLSLILVTTFFIFSELRFDWCESLIGGYMSAINDARPENGAVWKEGAQASRAQAHLETLVTQRQEILRTAKEADTFLELAENLFPGQWTGLDQSRFTKLYLDLPIDAAKKIISPIELISLFKGRLLKKIFCEGTGSGLTIYFLGVSNRVIRKIDMDKDLMKNLVNGTSPFLGTLEALEGFEGRIFSADRFFTAVSNLPEELHPGLISYPEQLLLEEGTIVRAGIWNQAESGYIRLGFEFQVRGETKVLFVKGREWAVWQLAQKLSEGSS